MNMKKIILIITILVTTSIYTQNSDIIKITTSASGITKEIAVQDALRSALEQSYGSFISTKTNIKNDELINDEIVSITNGDIHKYEIISEFIVDGRYNVTVESEISLNQINTFKRQIGESATKFDGALFGVKIKLQDINEKSERISLKNLFVSLRSMYNESVDISLENYSEPRIKDGGGYGINFKVRLDYNKNIVTFNDHLTKSLKSIAMNETENGLYSSNGKSTYLLIIDHEKYYFRNNDSMWRITSFLQELLEMNYFNYELSDNIEVLFDPYELDRHSFSFGSNNWSKKHKSNFYQAANYITGGKEPPRSIYRSDFDEIMDWKKQRNNFLIPGIYFQRYISDEEKLYNNNNNYFSFSTMGFSYPSTRKCNRENNFQCPEWEYVMHFTSKCKPFIYNEEGVINSRTSWDNGDFYVYDTISKYNSYRKNWYLDKRSYKYSEIHGNIYEFIPIYELNRKNMIGLKLNDSSMDPIIIQPFLSKESNKLEYYFKVSNPNDFGDGEVFKRHENADTFFFDDKKEFDFDLFWNLAGIYIDYELFLKSGTGYEKYNYSRGWYTDTEYSSINSDLSDIKLSKKKKQELRKIINTPNQGEADNLTSLKKYLSYDFATKWQNYINTTLDPYRYTYTTFNIELIFSEEKLSKISEFKLERSTDTWNWRN